MESVPKLVNDYMTKKLKVDEFVTHTLPFAQINEAFDLMHQGKRYNFPQTETRPVDLLSVMTRDLFDSSRVVRSCFIVN